MKFCNKIILLAVLTALAASPVHAATNQGTLVRGSDGLWTIVPPPGMPLVQATKPSAASYSTWILPYVVSALALGLSAASFFVNRPSAMEERIAMAVDMAMLAAKHTPLNAASILSAQ